MERIEKVENVEKAENAEQTEQAEKTEYNTNSIYAPEVHLLNKVSQSIYHRPV